MTEVDTKRVLIVEDMEDLAGFVKIALEEMGLEAFHMNTAPKALDFLENHNPDLIILDIGLPGMSGWQLLEAISEQRKQNNMRIIISTAFQDPANRLIGKLQTVDAYLQKPYDFAELRKVVMSLLTSPAE